MDIAESAVKFGEHVVVPAAEVTVGATASSVLIGALSGVVPQAGADPVRIALKLLAGAGLALVDNEHVRNVGVGAALEGLLDILQTTGVNRLIPQGGIDRAGPSPVSAPVPCSQCVTNCAHCQPGASYGVPQQPAMTRMGLMGPAQNTPTVGSHLSRETAEGWYGSYPRLAQVSHMEARTWNDGQQVMRVAPRVSVV